MSIRIKRIYDEPSDDDGYRVLVDRLWPRGVRKDAAGLDAWAKGVAPSPELRKTFGHAPERFEEFTELYRAELDDLAHEIETLLADVPGNTLTLLYAARDRQHNHAIVLREYLMASR
ncbi:MAG: DUF488 domain-containing protein [Planctomycetota bacterium]